MTKPTTGEWPNDQLEALHACHIVEETFAAHVLDASFVRENSDLWNAAESVHAAIAALYQAIGNAEAGE